MADHVYEEPNEVLEKEPSPYLVPGQNINKSKASEYQIPEDLEEEFDFLPDKSSKPPAKPSSTTPGGAAAYQVPDLEEEFDFLPSKPAPPPAPPGSGATAALAVPGLAPSLASDFEIVPEKPKSAEEQDEYDEVDEPEESVPAKAPQYENVPGKAAADKKGLVAGTIPAPEPPAPKPAAAPKPPVCQDTVEYVPSTRLILLLQPGAPVYKAQVRTKRPTPNPDGRAEYACRSIPRPARVLTCPQIGALVQDKREAEEVRA